jgi:hypothetical protein
MQRMGNLCGFTVEDMKMGRNDPGAGGIPRFRHGPMVDDQLVTPRSI